jgi:hypothetical protein
MALLKRRLRMSHMHAPQVQGGSSQSHFTYANRHWHLACPDSLSSGRGLERKSRSFLWILDGHAQYA